MKKKELLEWFEPVFVTMVYFASLFGLSLLMGCKSSNHNIVEIVKTDTLHVYHTDTLKVVHNDTIYSVITQTVHDSIVKETIIKEVVNELGEVIHSEKETSSAVFHNSDTNSQYIQHTVDSIIQAKLDSISHISHEDEPVIVEVEKTAPWYEKIWGWIKDRFATIGVCVVILLILYFGGKKLKDYIL